MVGRPFRRTLSIIAGLLLIACGERSLNPQYSTEIQVALLLTDHPFTGGADSGLYATVAEVGTPVNTPLVRADRFEMTRRSDGARFAWRWLPESTTVVGARPMNMPSNYYLPYETTEAGLGASEIRAGEWYDVVIEVGEHRLDGSAKVPDPIVLAPGPTDGDSIVRWHASDGAAAYALGISGTSDAASLFAHTTTDTLVQIFFGPYRSAYDPFYLPVFALDGNYAALLEDRRLTAAGVRGGVGVIGAYSYTVARIQPSVR